MLTMDKLAGRYLRQLLPLNPILAGFWVLRDLVLQIVGFLPFFAQRLLVAAHLELSIYAFICCTAAHNPFGSGQLLNLFHQILRPKPFTRELRTCTQMGSVLSNAIPQSHGQVTLAKRWIGWSNIYIERKPRPVKPAPPPLFGLGFEFLRRPTLLKVLQGKDSSLINSIDRLQAEITAAVKSLHTLGLSHLDLKEDNLIFRGRTSELWPHRDSGNDPRPDNATPGLPCWYLIDSSHTDFGLISLSIHGKVTARQTHGILNACLVHEESSL